MDDGTHVSLSEPTVFVLGAGASHAYGFPLGSELKDKILEHFDINTRRRMEEVGFDKDLVDSFQEALRYSQHETIDIFLEHKTSYRELGSYLIAIAMMPFEDPNKLFPRRDWYWDLYRVLRFDDEKSDPAQLGVVTLNYDRSFEHFMTKTIDFNVHDARVKDAQAKWSKITVVHAHGSLGDYPVVTYGITPRDGEALRRAAERIRIVSDRLDESPDFIDAKVLIGTARNVVFLGFGYNERTLNALLRNVDMNQTRFFGTAVKLPEERKRELSEAFSNKIVLGGENQDCAAFLRYIGVIPDE